MRYRRLVVLILLVTTALLPGPVRAGGDHPSGVWPLSPTPRVVRAFEPPAAPWGPGHRGVDLAGAVGQPVRAALPGRVSFSGPLFGRGVVVVDHGATRTTYEPVSGRLPVGAAVDRGTVIGALELAGSHCWPAACLHWGWRRGETYLDPLLLVGLGRVRLLPWAGAPVPSAPTIERTLDVPARSPWCQARGWACW
jgi:murein DD-endopeptidase MepM/ murein hydrolase activator NlpD